ncbi:hypothetical protein CBER1_03903 [Cercospora berteroae]|uniref:HTH La-type RNA-binding domain-containing protein n=1 Tax=Cercospora berteroae TaxID=357750 RepID=A0A2S6C9W2_9PEZI|nr:hypothetical protein CBER1_03903 [Cercospora berteroae]
MASPLKDVTNMVKDAVQSSVDQARSFIQGTTTDEDNNALHTKEHQSTSGNVDKGLAPPPPLSTGDQESGDVEYTNEMARPKAFSIPDDGNTKKTEKAPVSEQAVETAGASASRTAQTPHAHVSQVIGTDGLHPETAAIVRQVEFYFSDENLVTDQHLLSRTGPGGIGWVSINEILGFKKMRQFKPRSKVKASVATSSMLEMKENKYIRRKAPLKVTPKVAPRMEPKRQRDQLLVQKPWLTKGMLVATGFEEYATDGPITPQQYEEERVLFDVEDAITTRLEYAVTRFSSRKKMHQASLAVFSKFLLLGGFESLTHMFAGGLDKKELEGYDKEEILQMKAKFGVSDVVVDGLDKHSLDAGSWLVDFAGMANAFLSSEFFQHFDWYDEKVLFEATNVLRKFYDYLLHHGVCPEYEEDIYRAIDVCRIANEEVPELARLDSGFPGQFNMAASTLHSGFYAQIRPFDGAADWVLAGDQIGLSDKDAWLAFSAGIMAHATNEQMNEIFRARKNGEKLTVVTEEDIGLEIVRVEQGSEQAAQIYEDDRIKGTFIKRTGKLHCKSWVHPGSAPQDLPPTVTDKKTKTYEFWVEEDILQHCKKGMKLEANVGRLENGIMWLDLVDNVYPSFFKWTLNERMREWKEPGSPKAWMKRASGKQQVEESQDVVKHEIQDETPD